MVWGGIDTGAHGNHFQKLLNMNPDVVENSVSKIKNLLDQGNIRAAFEALETTDKLSGVGHAFHTKLLYFLGDSVENLSVKPLIFDLRTKNAYCAMIYQLSDHRHNLFFSSTQYISTNNPYVSAKPAQLIDAYIAYLTDMESWASHIGVSSWQLEQFLFGWRMNQRNGYILKFKNPRLEIRIILIERGNVPIF
jgi:hypothetical protein